VDWCFVCTKHVRVDMSIVRALVHSLPKAKISSYVKIASSILQKDPQTRTHRHNHGYIYKPSSLPAPQTCARISHTHNNINAYTHSHSNTQPHTRTKHDFPTQHTRAHAHAYLCWLMHTQFNTLLRISEPGASRAGAGAFCCS